MMLMVILVLIVGLLIKRAGTPVRVPPVFSRSVGSQP
jgi:hypothetical protein